MTTLHDKLKALKPSPRRKDGRANSWSAHAAIFVLVNIDELLAATAPGEAVAWRVRHKSEDKWHIFASRHECGDITWGDPQEWFDVEPLYTHSPRNEAAEASMLDAPADARLSDLSDEMHSYASQTTTESFTARRVGDWAARITGVRGTTPLQSATTLGELTMDPNNSHSRLRAKIATLKAQLRDRDERIELASAMLVSIRADIQGETPPE